jgi:hypothetical protein
MRTKLPLQRPDKHNEAKIAAAALAIAAAVAIFNQFKPTPESKMEQKPQPTHQERHIIQVIQKPAPQFLFQDDVQIKKPEPSPNLIDPFVKDLGKKMPYESFDCPSVPLQRRHKELFKELLSDETNDMVKSFVKVSEHFDSSFAVMPFEFPSALSDADISKVLCEGPDCHISLLGQIASLKKQKNTGGLSGIVKYLDALNVEWEEKNGNINTLLSVYMQKYTDAIWGEQNTVPSLRCIARNAVAIKLLHDTRSALAALLIENPSLGQFVLDGLTTFQRGRLMSYCASALFDTNSADSEPLETFYSSLSAEDRMSFDAMLDSIAGPESYYLSYENGGLAMAETAANQAIDPDLRSKMQGIVMRSKTQAAANEESMKADGMENRSDDAFSLQFEDSFTK